jgi:adenosylmethionine-8-amino-7-oxononanoate aminotransferase
MIATSAPVRPPFGGPQDLFNSTKNTVGLPTIVRGEGIYIFDEHGKRYLDAISGAMTAQLGQGNQRVLDAMHAQGMRHSFSYVRTTRHLPNLELTEKIARLAGPGFERVHLSSGGSEAVEMGIKFLRQYAFATGQKRKTKVLSLMPSYHGGTLATIGWTGDEDSAAVWGDMAHFSTKIPAPLSYRPPGSGTSRDGALFCAARIEEAILKLGAENVLAFIMEPVGGQSTGANVPDPVFFTELRRICDRHGVYIVFDEVMSACRTGSFLAAHRIEGCKPDIVVTAKGLGAGYTPMGAVLAPAKMVDELAGLTGFNLSHTYGANPISCAGACAVLDETVERDLFGNSARMGNYLRERLQDLQRRSPVIGDVRGKGLLMAVEYVRDRETKEPFSAEVFASDRIRQIGLTHGVMLYSRRQNQGRYGEWSLIAPPLIINQSQADELVDALGKSVAQFTDEMTRQGVLA